MKEIRGFDSLNEEQKRHLEKLSKLSDCDIDTSDIPEWSEEDFEKSVRFQDVYKSRKQQITTRLDVDILMWLKSHGKGYQTLMNDLLRKEMNEEINSKA